MTPEQESPSRNRIAQTIRVVCSQWNTGLVLATTMAGLLGFGVVAFADAQVDVKIHIKGTKTATSTLSGQLSLTSVTEKSLSYTCKVKKGQCTIKNVKGGQYSSSFVSEDKKHKAPKRTVFIPDSGTVKLSVAVD